MTISVAEVARQLGLDHRRHLAGHHLAGRAVDGEQVALAQPRAPPPASAPAP